MSDRAAIERRGFALAAVNSRARDAGETPTPEELLDRIGAHGHEGAAAVATAAGS